MPTYAYRCTECGHSFDIQQSMSDDPLTVCPECGGKLRKLYNFGGVGFVGSGFYRTDSRSESAKSSGSTSDSGGSSSSATAASSTSSS